MTFVLAEKVDQLSLTGFNRAFDNRPVEFFHLALAELLRQPSGGLGSPREQHHSGHRRIQSAHDSKIYVPRFVILSPDVLLRRR